MKKIICLSIINFLFYFSSQAMAGCQSDVDKTLYTGRNLHSRSTTLILELGNGNIVKKRMPNIYCGHLRIKLKIKSHLQELDC